MFICFEIFIVAIEDAQAFGKECRDERPLSAKLTSLLPSQFLGPDGNPVPDLYLRILQVCEFVAGMTDSYAMTLYRRLRGIELPS